MNPTPTAPYTTGHVGLNVSDLQRSTRFYRGVFGWDVLHESTQAGRAFALLGLAGTPIVTLWQQSSGAVQTDRPGLHHMSFQASSLAQVQAAEARVRELGAPIYHGGVVPHAEGAPSSGLYFQDPDGIRLEIFAAAAVPDRAAPYAEAPTCGFF